MLTQCPIRSWLILWYVTCLMRVLMEDSSRRVNLPQTDQEPGVVSRERIAWDFGGNGHTVYAQRPSWGLCFQQAWLNNNIPDLGWKSPVQVTSWKVTGWGGRFNDKGFPTFKEQILLFYKKSGCLIRLISKVLICIVYQRLRSSFGWTGFPGFTALVQY